MLQFSVMPIQDLASWPCLYPHAQLLDQVPSPWTDMLQFSFLQEAQAVG